MIEPTKAKALAEPFPAAMLRSLSKGGTSLTYVPAPEVITRLNTVLGVAAWSFTVVEHFMFEEHVVVHGRLVVGDATYEQFGGQPLKRFKEEKGGGPLDVADDYKGAASDALKKCAAMLGVGLELARKEEAIHESLRQDQANAAIPCPVPECAVEAPRPELRVHLVDVHGWVKKPNGAVVPPDVAETAPERPAESPRTPQATPPPIDTPEDRPAAPTSPTGMSEEAAVRLIEERLGGEVLPPTSGAGTDSGEIPDEPEFDVDNEADPVPATTDSRQSTEPITDAQVEVLAGLVANLQKQASRAYADWRRKQGDIKGKQWNQLTQGQAYRILDFLRSLPGVEL